LINPKKKKHFQCFFSDMTPTDRVIFGWELAIDLSLGRVDEYTEREETRESVCFQVNVE
jgi:hypothetical protein